MALSGVRQMSVIATRLLIGLRFVPHRAWDNVVLKEALLRERFRGGSICCLSAY